MPPSPFAGVSSQERVLLILMPASEILPANLGRKNVAIIQTMLFYQRPMGPTIATVCPCFTSKLSAFKAALSGLEG